ncbi:MAG: hypothetical protein EXS37_12425 [Opitutus sp.]|nr:hypothetical protein [Opitutus sp.]
MKNFPALNPAILGRATCGRLNAVHELTQRLIVLQALVRTWQTRLRLRLRSTLLDIGMCLRAMETTCGIDRAQAMPLPAAR